MRFLLGLVLFFGPMTVAENGRFGAPQYDSFRSLTPTEHQAFGRAYEELFKPGFAHSMGYTGRIPIVSFYGTEEGKKELEQLGATYLGFAENYSGLFFVGRSGTGLKAYFEGLNRGLDKWLCDLRDLPFSNRSFESLHELERQALREHLTANGLSPDQIMSSPKPLLLVDFVHSGHTVVSLMKEISSWAREAGVEPEVKAKVHFWGLYPARLLSEHHLIDLARSSAKEFRTAYRPPTEQEIQSAAEHLPLPQNDLLKELAGKVIRTQISLGLYNYAGTHAPLVQQSFTRERWAETKGDPNTFSTGPRHPALIELHYLISLGIAHGRARQQGAFSLSFEDPDPQGCARRLKDLTA